MPTGGGATWPRAGRRSSTPLVGNAAVAVTKFGAAEELVVEDGDDAATAAVAYGGGIADFADHMIAAAAVRAGCATLYTFDRKAARHNSVTLLVK